MGSWSSDKKFTHTDKTKCERLMFNSLIQKLEKLRTELSQLFKTCSNWSQCWRTNKEIWGKRSNSHSGYSGVNEQGTSWKLFWHEVKFVLHSCIQPLVDMDQNQKVGKNSKLNWRNLQNPRSFSKVRLLHRWALRHHSHQSDPCLEAVWRKHWGIFTKPQTFSKRKLPWNFKIWPLLCACRSPYSDGTNFRNLYNKNFRIAAHECWRRRDTALKIFWFFFLHVSYR